MTKKEATTNGYVALNATLSNLMNSGRSVGIHKVSFNEGDTASFRELTLNEGKSNEQKGLYPFLYGFSAVKLISAGAPVEREEVSVEVKDKENETYVKFIVTETKVLWIEVFEDKTRTKINGRYPKAIKILWDKSDEEKEEE
jgi:hypothetical protein